MQASGVTVAGGSAAFISACGSSGPSSPDAARDAALLNSGRALTLSLEAAYAQTAPLLAGPVRAITGRFRAPRRCRRPPDWRRRSASSAVPL